MFLRQKKGGVGAAGRRKRGDERHGLAWERSIKDSGRNILNVLEELDLRPYLFFSYIKANNIIQQFQRERLNILPGEKGRSGEKGH